MIDLQVSQLAGNIIDIHESETHPRHQTNGMIENARAKAGSASVAHLNRKVAHTLMRVNLDDFCDRRLYNTNVAAKMFLLTKPK